MQNFVLSKDSIKTIFDTNQLAKKSFERYFVTVKGICIPEVLGPKTQYQRTIIESPNYEKVFREFRISDNYSVIRINFIGVFRGLKNVTMVQGFTIEDNNIYCVTEPHKDIVKRNDDIGDDETITLMSDGNFRVHVGKIIENYKDEAIYRLASRYVSEFNGEGLESSENLDVHLPDYTDRMTNESVLSIYNKEIVPLEKDGLVVILLKPLIHAIAKKSTIDYKFTRHDPETGMFVTYISIVRPKGLRSHHKFEAVNLG